MVTFGLYFVIFFSRSITIEKSGYYLGHEHIWSDWPLHIAITSIFAYKSPDTWFAYHPMYSGGKFSYPFLTDFISGMLVRVGLSLPLAITIPSIIFSLFLIIGMYVLLFQLFKSRKIAVFAIFIFFLSSGPGFIDFFKKFFAHPALNMLLYPPTHYTRIDQYAWYSGNVIVGLLVPQRAFLLGMTISIWIMAGLVYVMRRIRDTVPIKNILILLGLLAGSLPIVHMHSFIIVVIVTGLMCFASLKYWKLLLFYIIPATILSSALYLIFISGGIQIDNFTTWLPGWTAKDSFIGWLKMWFSLWGFTIPVSIIGLFFIRNKINAVKAWVIGFIIIFISANLILFQPIAWDNSKLFVWSYFAFSSLCAITIVKLLNKGFIAIFIAIIIFLSLTLTGFLELTRLQAINRNKLQLTATDDINLGIQIRNKTNPLSVFLTGTSTNHFIMVWGARSIVMGFIPWVENFGFSPNNRSQDIIKMYSGEESSMSLLRQYKISYVVIGPGEKYEFKVNESYFKENFPTAFANKSYQIYDVRSFTKRP